MYGRTPARQVLAVGDFGGAADALKQTLDTAGFLTLCVPDGDVALDAARVIQFDAVIIDLALQGLDGIALRRALNGASPMKSIAVSANESDQEERQCAEAGFDALVRRPLYARLILAAVAGVLCEAIANRVPQDW
jgi:DNA-binding response OmpR family regulator